jgi:hypothetical protein
MVFGSEDRNSVIIGGYLEKKDWEIRGWPFMWLLTIGRNFYVLSEWAIIFAL